MAEWLLKLQNFLFLPIYGDSHAAQVRSVWMFLDDLFCVDWMREFELNDVRGRRLFER